MFGELIRAGDGFFGFVGDVEFDIEIALSPVADGTKPDFRIEKKTESGARCDIGSASWRANDAAARQLDMTFEIGSRRYRAKAIAKKDDHEILKVVFDAARRRAALCCGRTDLQNSRLGASSVHDRRCS